MHPTRAVGPRGRRGHGHAGALHRNRTISGTRAAPSHSAGARDRPGAQDDQPAHRPSLTPANRGTSRVPTSPADQAHLPRSQPTQPANQLRSPSLRSANSATATVTCSGSSSSARSVVMGAVGILRHGGPLLVELLGGCPTPTTRQASGGDRHLNFYRDRDNLCRASQGEPNQQVNDVTSCLCREVGNPQDLTILSASVTSILVGSLPQGGRPWPMGGPSSPGEAERRAVGDVPHELDAGGCRRDHHLPVRIHLS